MTGTDALHLTVNGQNVAIGKAHEFYITEPLHLKKQPGESFSVTFDTFVRTLISSWLRVFLIESFFHSRFCFHTFSAPIVALISWNFTVSKQFFVWGQAK